MLLRLTDGERGHLLYRDILKDLTEFWLPWFTLGLSHLTRFLSGFTV
jgi:hypothetical protein